MPVFDDDKEERAVIICQRSSECSLLMRLISGPCFEDTCNDCGEKVMVAETSRPRVEEYPNHIFVCNRCAGSYMLDKEVKMQASDPRVDAFVQKNQDKLREYALEQYEPVVKEETDDTDNG